MECCLSTEAKLKSDKGYDDQSGDIAVKQGPIDASREAAFNQEVEDGYDNR